MLRQRRSLQKNSPLLRNSPASRQHRSKPTREDEKAHAQRIFEEWKKLNEEHKQKPIRSNETGNWKTFNKHPCTACDRNMAQARMLHWDDPELALSYEIIFWTQSPFLKSREEREKKQPKHFGKQDTISKKVTSRRASFDAHLHSFILENNFKVMVVRQRRAPFKKGPSFVSGTQTRRYRSEPGREAGPAGEAARRIREDFATFKKEYEQNPPSILGGRRGDVIRKSPMFRLREKYGAGVYHHFDMTSEEIFMQEMYFWGQDRSVKSSEQQFQKAMEALRQAGYDV
jgi:hypothetical protein